MFGRFFLREKLQNLPRLPEPCPLEIGTWNFEDHTQQLFGICPFHSRPLAVLSKLAR